MDNFDIRHWYLWTYQVHDGLFNMSVDQWLARNMMISLDHPILRFYGWDPHCISLGYHQKSTEINLNVCKEKKIEVVRRPTGGRAILHAEELTYSIIYPSGKINVTDFYRLTHLPFVAALKDFHVETEFNQTQPDFKGFYASEKSSICFATAAKYEVELNKKKVIGSAQRVYEHVILQHGSILLGQMHEQLIDILNISSEKKKLLKKHTRNNTAFIWQISKNITAKLLSEKIIEKFSEIFGINFIPFEKKISIIGKEELVRDNSLNILGQHKFLP